MSAAREVYLPAPGSPHWLSVGEHPGGLLYLAWGQRYYGRHPIHQRLHAGWTYLLVLSGRPCFSAGDRHYTTDRGSVIVAGPDVPYGWTDSPSASSSHLAWVWNQPQSIGSPVAPRTCWLRKAPPEVMQDLSDLHRRTRREVQRPDSISPHALMAIKALLDATLARCGSGTRAVESKDAQRLQLAQQWMQRHLEVRAPARALADYLGISPMSLQRLFRDLVGQSPGEAFFALRMGWAMKLLGQPGNSVKSVAYSLGYKHPSDFSRAFVKYHGLPPSRMQQRHRVPDEEKCLGRCRATE